MTFINFTLVYVTEGVINNKPILFTEHFESTHGIERRITELMHLGITRAQIEVFRSAPAKIDIKEIKTYEVTVR